MPAETAFRKLVAASSEDLASKSRQGRIGPLHRATTAYPSPVIEAAFNLPQPGAVSDLIQSENGFHVLRLVEKRPAVVPPFEEVKSW